MNSKHTALTGFTLSCLIISVNPIQAQQNNTEDHNLESIVITGSMIPQQSNDVASPTIIIDREKISQSGATTTNDLLKYLTINTGAEINSDPFTQSSSAGTAQINLRGLGLASTLTLINGRRTTLSGAFSVDGANFVDINNIPLSAIERIEILKDGASALYGSDAVAGVVNFITRKNFNGFELNGGHKSVASGSNNDTDLNIAWGMQDGSLSAMTTLSYYNQEPMSTTERDFTLGTGTSTLGSPGAFIPIAVIDASSPYKPYELLAPAGTPFRDSGCADAGGTPDSALPFGTCNLDYLSYSYLMADESRTLAMATLDYQVDSQQAYFAEFSLTDSDSRFTTAPSFANLTFPIVPADNPGNLTANGGFGTPVVYLGRPMGDGYAAQVNKRDSKNYRLVTGSRQTFNNGGQLETAYQYSFNEFKYEGADTLIDRFSAALNGVGGPNNDEYFNPFSSAYTNPALANSQAVIDDFWVTFNHKVTAKLHTLDSTFTSSFSATQASQIETALGMQYRHESNEQVADENSQALNYAFVSGTQSSKGDRDVIAVFAEAAIPYRDNVRIQLAARTEHYGGKTGSTFDPKIGILWSPNQDIQVRGSASTAFRAPSLQQKSNSTVAVEQIGSDFVPVLTQANADLQPEEATIANLGASFQLSENLSASLDYWSYDYADIIIQESAEAIFANNPNDPKISYDSVTGKVTRVDVQFVNASSIKTSGLDFNLNYTFSTNYGIYLIDKQTSWIQRYDLKESEGGETIDAVGNRNGLNIARSLPPWRSNLSISWLMNRHSSTLITRYVDKYKDDANNNATIKQNIIHDIQYSYQIPYVGRWQSNLSLGILNLLDTDPPPVSTVMGYDTKIHDPRGQIFYVRVTASY
jgi:outer membrane receptor for ferrienterochelin and colicin